MIGTTANKITILRILTVPFFVATVLYYTPAKDYLRWAALGIFCFAVATDVLDGYVARKQSQRSQGGDLLDPLADKLLLNSAFICLYHAGLYFPRVHFPIWLVVTVISRDVILILGAVVIQMIHGKVKIIPTSLGKITAFFQMLSVFALLFQWGLSYYIWDITFAVTVISGLDYLWTGLKTLNHGEGLQ